jgi:hypothetical protein
LNGSISSQGLTGSRGGGGGGAGGSIVINVTSWFSGFGEVSARGGDGGTSGGQLSGGGGSGGRIALYAPYSSVFSGTIDCTGGMTVPLKNELSIKAGPGTIFVSLSSNNAARMSALIASTYPVLDPISGVKNMEPVKSSAADETLPLSAVGSVAWGAVHLQELGDEELPFNPTLGVNIHISGYQTCLNVAATSLRVNKIIADGYNATLVATKSTAVTFVSSAVLHSVSFHVLDASVVVTSGELLVSSSARLVSYAGSRVTSPSVVRSGSGSGLVHLNSLFVEENGFVEVAPNADVDFEGLVFNISAGGGINVRENAVLRVLGPIVHMQSSKIYGEGSNSVLNISSSSTLSFDADVNIQNITLSYFGKVVFHNGDVNLEANSKLLSAGNSHFSSNGGRITCAENGGSFQVSSLSTFTAQNNAETYIMCPFTLKGSVIIEIGSKLFLNGGGVAVASSSLTNHGECVFAAGSASLSFIFELGAAASGMGFYLVRSSVDAPKNTLISITVEDSGILRFTQYLYSIGSVFLSRGASVAIMSTSEVSVGRLTIDAGKLDIDGNMVVTEYGYLSEVHISGSGALAFETGSNTKLDAFGWSYFEGIRIINRGHMNVSSQRMEGNGIFEWTRGATFENEGVVKIHNSTSFLTSSVLTFFKKHEGTQTVDAIGGETLIDTSLVDCARACRENDLMITRKNGRKVEIVAMKCYGFLYNNYTRKCILQSYSRLNFLRKDTTFDRKFRWDFYENYYLRPFISNQGLISTGTNPTDHSSIRIVMGVPFNNSGNIAISNSGHTVSIFNEFRSPGNASIAGILNIGRANSSSVVYVSGITDGSGTLNYIGVDVTLSAFSLHASSSLSLNLENSSLTFLADGLRRVHVKSLTLNSGDMVTNEPMMYKIASVLSLSGDSNIRSAIGAIASDPQGFNCGSELCGDCSFVANEISLMGTSAINCSALMIQAPVLSILDKDSVLTCTGRGNHLTNSPSSLSAGIYSSSGSSGGSYGGTGAAGNGALTGAVGYYGSTYMPNLWGSAGGHNGGASSRLSAGGGSMKISITKNLTVNGVISCDGASPWNTLFGGGSGGSIEISAGKHLLGTGQITSKGGSVLCTLPDRCGSGGGGRILVDAKLRLFKGMFSAEGGYANKVLSRTGSPGTVHLIARDQGITQHSVLVNSYDRISSLPTYIVDSLEGSDIDDLLVSNSAHVIVNCVAEAFRVETISGDGTGTVEFVNTSVVIPSENLVVANASVRIGNSFISALSYTVSDGGKLSLSALGASSGHATAHYTASSITLELGGILSLQYPDPSNNSVIILTVNSLSIDETSTLESDGQGFSCTDFLGSEVIELDPGCGYHGSMGGSGGSMGGEGGEGMSSPMKGTPHGDSYMPMSFGSGGGGAWDGTVLGGRGGGAVRIIASSLIVNGVLSANGAEGNMPGSGGGSGGSIFITADSFGGTGAISANGGAGLFSDEFLGGGGSGGRIAIYLDNEDGDSYSGTITSFGGIFSADEEETLQFTYGDSIYEWLMSKPSRAAAGTVFRSWNAPLKSEFTIDNKGGLDAVTVAKLVDASGKDVPLMETFALNSLFTTVSFGSEDVSTLNIFRDAKVQSESGDDFSISNFFSDGTGKFIVSRNSSLHVTSTFTLNSFELHVQGTARGASTLNIGAGGQLLLYPRSHWCYFPVSSGTDCDSYSSNFTFNTVSISGSSGITVKGGTEFAQGHQATIFYVEGSLSLSDSTSYLSADSEGFTGARQGDLPDPYHGKSRLDAGDGGSHAGYGGTLRGDDGYVYGSAIQPSHWGGGGGSTYQFPGMNGGGSLHVVSKGNILNNGRISSNGQSCSTDTPMSSGGGGAGGSVWIEMIDASAALSGSGVISAAGGDSCLGEGGAGAGGRVAIYEATKGSSFSGSYNVLPGIQANSYGIYPAGGTIYWADMNGDNGVVTSVSRTSNSFGTYATSNLIERPIVKNFDRIVVGNSALIFDDQWDILLLDNGIVECGSELDIHHIMGCSNGGTIKLTGNSSLQILGSLILSNTGLELSGSSHMHVQNSVILGSSSTLFVSPNDTYISTEIPEAHGDILCSKYGTYCFSDLTIAGQGLLKFSGVEAFPNMSQTLHIFGTLIVDSGGVIDASGVAMALLNWDGSVLPRGHGAPTTSGFMGASGGGNGGYGSLGTLNVASGSHARSNAFRPYGAGGPGGSSSQRGGAGGGGLLVNVFGDTVVSGAILSNGISGDINGGNGGGAGGSIHLITYGTFTGATTGSLAANGGHGGISQTSHVHGGAGSGGRILVQACQSTFSGSYSALGGLSMTTIGFNPSRSYIYQKNFEADRFELRNNTAIIAGGAGTIVIASLAMPECAVISSSLTVNSWKTSEYLADISIIVSSIRTIYPEKRILYSSATSLADDDYEYFCCHNPATDSLIVDELKISYSKAKLYVESDRTLEFGSIVGTGASSLDILSGGALKINSGNHLIVNNITLNIYGTVIGSITSDVSFHDSKIAIFDGSLYSDGVSSSPTWTVRNIALSNSVLSGAVVNISASRLDMVLGSRIDANFKGYSGGASGGENGRGPGGGGRGEFGASGGGHGGQGLPGATALRFESMARSKVGAFPGRNLDDAMSSGSLMDKSIGGKAYGSIEYPDTPGSGGGSALGPYGQGGSGGGVIHLKLTGDISMSADAVISSNGENQLSGGGGGAGGSINIGCARLLGSGIVTASGGCSCPDSSCSVGDLTHPGGAGGGGRIAIFGDISSFGGYVLAKPGCGTLEPELASIPDYLGSIFYTHHVVTPWYRENFEGVTGKFIDVVLSEIPLAVMSTIESCGSGEGSIASESQRNAIVRGFWRIRFRSEWSSVLLSSQATAADVFASLKNISELSDVAFKVTRSPSSCNGWIWRVVFFDSVNRFGLEVDSKSLFSTDNNATMTVARQVLSAPLGEAWDANQNTVFRISDLSSIVQFSKPLGVETIGYWSDINSFRVIPGTEVPDLSTEIGSLKLTYFRPIPTLDGALSGYTSIDLQTAG